MIVLSLLVVGATVTTCIMAFLGCVKSNDPVGSGLIGTFAGYLISESKNVMGYWFGSSRGSADKDKAINEIATGANGNVTVKESGPVTVNTKTDAKPDPAPPA